MSVCVPNHFSWVQLFATLWTVAHQGFSRKDTVLQGIFPTPAMEAECLISSIDRKIIYRSCHPGRPDTRWGFVNILGLLVGNLGESTQTEFCQGFQSGKSTDVQMFLIDEETELLPAGSSRPVCRGQQQLSAGILSEASLLALVFSSPWPRVQVQSPWPLESLSFHLHSRVFRCKAPGPWCREWFLIGANQSWSSLFPL